ncbi:MAG: protein translocase subunit SecD [Candidatus Brocadiia bacterium]
MSGRATKWIIFVLLPLVLALYASYPPAGVVTERVRLVKDQAETAEEARAHNVEVGEDYVVDSEVMSATLLPLAYGDKDVETRRLETREDGTYVVEQVTRARGRIKLGLDLAGGTELLYKLDPREEGEGFQGKVGNTIDILKKRIDPGNVKEYRIQAAGEDRILIQVPQATPAEVEQLKRRLERMGKLEFKLAVPKASGQARFQQWYQEARAGNVPDGYVKMYIEGDQSNEFHLVKEGEPELTGEYLSDVYPTYKGVQPVVGFQFDAIGSRRFAYVTESNIGWSLAIILDGALKSAPTIRERIAGQGVIEGQFTQQEVNDMVNVLRAGSLPMDIELLQESTVGPQLGRDSIRRGLTALAVAGLLVLAFIGVYYMVCGLVADGALILNLVLLVGILGILGAALTLPGLAGILLTVGMAVDANVLIFERIREESESGKGVRAALRNGYERAFTTIVDANVTTLLTAVILYLVGTGPVRGFAVTLSFGILLSMFTALVVTRLAFETFIDKGWMEEFKMFSFIGTPSIDFSGIRKPAYIISTLVVAVGMVAFISRGGALYDIDFSGGSLVQVSLAKATPVSEVRARMEALGYPGAEVQALRATGSGQEGFTDFGIRVKGADLQQIRNEIKPEIFRKLADAGLVSKATQIDVSADRRALLVKLDQAGSEMDVRRALGADSPYTLGQVGTVAAAGEPATKEVTVYLGNVPGILGEREKWSRALAALNWTNVETRDYVIQSLEQTEGGLRVTLDAPLQWQVLASELDRRGFPELQVATRGEATATLVLKGQAEALERFQTELPAGAELRAVPTVTIEGATVTARLTEEFTEADVRVFFERQELRDVLVVPLDVESNEFRLNLSYAPLRENLREAFADLAPRAGGVTFEELGREGDDVRVRMVLDQPMAFGDVKHYVESAGIGPYAAEIIQDESQYSLDTVVEEVELLVPAGKVEAMEEQLGASFGEPQPVQRILSIGAEVAEELQGRALLAVIFASVIIVLYVAARFHAFRFGVAAVIALVHDVLITAGLIALADWSGVMGDVKINLAMLAAFLTILGYSLNDTIVVFDRIRENMGLLGRNKVSPDLVNLSINQTLSRTVLTSMTTLMVVVVLYLLAGPALRGLALTLIFGVVVGTYSSMFIASPVLLDWAGLTGAVRGFFRVVFFPVRMSFRLLGMAFGTSS